MVSRLFDGDKRDRTADLLNAIVEWVFTRWNNMQILDVLGQKNEKKIHYFHFYAYTCFGVVVKIVVRKVPHFPRVPHPKSMAHRRS